MSDQIEANLEDLVIPIEIGKTLYESYDAYLNIFDKPDQVYGKSLQALDKEIGEIVFKNGNNYKGNIQNGLLHGQGVFTWANGTVFEGDFQYNKIQGRGKYTWIDGSSYEGEVFNNKRHGQGFFKSCDGQSEYTGEWIEGQKQGKGVIKYANGSVYEGQFYKGTKDGQGVMKYASGNFYEGEWQNDQKNGFGTMNWLNINEKYYGQWKDNKQNGFGTHIWIEYKGEGKFLRNRYEGNWKDSKRHGYGIFYYANGSKYEGEWKNNLKHGNAVFIDENGETIQALFEDDRMQFKKEVQTQLEEIDISIIPKNSQVDEYLVNQDKSIKSALSAKKIDDQNQSIAKQSSNGGDKKSILQSSNIMPQQSNQQILNQKKQEAQQSQYSKVQKSRSQSPVENTKENTKDEQTKEITPILKDKRDEKNVEQNIYYKILKIQDLLIGQQNNEQIQNNIATMLLRHHSTLKKYYKLFSQSQENNENSFSLTQGQLWKWLFKSKIFDQFVTIPQVNRLFGLYGIEQITSNELQLQSKMDFLASYESKAVTDFQLNNYQLMIKILKKQGASQQLIDVDQIQTDIHDRNNILFFRDFVNYLVRLAYAKFQDIENLNRSIEKLVIEYLQNNIPYDEYANETLKVDDALQNKIEKISKHYQTELYQTFKKFSNQIISDETMCVKYLYKLLQIVDNYDQKFLQQIIQFDYIEEYKIEQIEEKLKNIEKKINDQNVTSSKNKKKQAVDPQIQQELENLKDMYQKYKIQLSRQEINFYQFNVIVLRYLLKKDKNKLYNCKDIDILISKMSPYINQIKGFELEIQRPQLRPSIYPATLKDHLKKNMLIEKQKEAELSQQKKLKDEERKKEARERIKMQHEDKNVILPEEIVNQTE